MFAHSAELRQGLAQSLALLATRGTAERLTDTIPLQARVDRVVRSVLPASSTWRRWASLGELLPLVAEAAPEMLLEAAEAGVSGDQPELAKLFLEEGDGFTGRAEHTGLLWALERLAWSATICRARPLVLAKLAQHDSGGKWANRPKASLRDVFFSWMPHTSAPVNQRLEVIELLLQRQPAAGWELLLALLPEVHESIMQHSTPDWRFWAEGWKREVSGTEYRQTVNRLVELSLGAVKAVPTWWPAFLDSIPAFRGTGFEKALRALEELDPASLPAATCKTLWAEVRELVSKHGYFADADWALPKELVSRFAAVRDKLEPSDAVERFIPLFKHGFTAEGDSSLSWRNRSGCAGRSARSR